MSSDANTFIGSSSLPAVPLSTVAIVANAAMQQQQQQQQQQQPAKAQPAQPTRLETLDEPVSATIMRDIRRVAIKLRHVFLPFGTVRELRNWDLWGPLILCLMLAATLSFTAPDNQAALIFSAVFVIVWCGAGVVALNAALLGGKISFLQSVCVLGYCIAPLNLASILCLTWTNHVYRILIVLVAFLWAARASAGFMAQLVSIERKLLAVYPVLLFYLTIGWMILLQ